MRNPASTNKSESLTRRRDIDRADIVNINPISFESPVWKPRDDRRREPIHRYQIDGAAPAYSRSNLTQQTPCYNNNPLSPITIHREPNAPPQTIPSNPHRRTLRDRLDYLYWKIYVRTSFLRHSRRHGDVTTVATGAMTSVMRSRRSSDSGGKVVRYTPCKQQGEQTDEEESEELEVICIFLHLFALICINLHICHNLHIYLLMYSELGRS